MKGPAGAAAATSGRRSTGRPVKRASGFRASRSGTSRGTWASRASRRGPFRSGRSPSGARARPDLGGRARGYRRHRGRPALPVAAGPSAHSGQRGRGCGQGPQAPGGSTVASRAFRTELLGPTSYPPPPGTRRRGGTCALLPLRGRMVKGRRRWTAAPLRAEPGTRSLAALALRLGPTSGLRAGERRPRGAAALMERWTGRKGAGPGSAAKRHSSAGPWREERRSWSRASMIFIALGRYVQEA